MVATKAPTDKWVDVHESAHGLGMRTTATMMFGIDETYAERVEHFRVVRDLQDRTGGFTAWIPWTFVEENTALDGQVATAGGFEYLKTLAVRRLYLDNIRHVQGSWVTQGPKIGQTSLAFGADDLGSIMIEENVVYAAGARNRMTQDEMRRLISDAATNRYSGARSTTRAGTSAAPRRSRSPGSAREPPDGRRRPRRLGRFGVGRPLRKPGRPDRRTLFAQHDPDRSRDEEEDSSDSAQQQRVRRCFQGGRRGTGTARRRSPLLGLAGAQVEEEVGRRRTDRRGPSRGPEDEAPDRSGTSALRVLRGSSFRTAPMVSMIRAGRKPAGR